MEQVVIEPDGKWSTPKGDDVTGTNGATPPAEDEDDLIEIKEPGILSGFTPVKQEPVTTELSLQQTPLQLREPSSMTPGASQSTNKRSASQVIDLTGSDDDEEPVRPAKRPALGTPSRPFTSSGFRSPLNDGYTNGQSYSFGTPSQSGSYT